MERAPPNSGADKRRKRTIHLVRLKYIATRRCASDGNRKKKGIQCAGRTTSETYPARAWNNLNVSRKPPRVVKFFRYLNIPRPVGEPVDAGEIPGIKMRVIDQDFPIKQAGIDPFAEADTPRKKHSQGSHVGIIEPAESRANGTLPTWRGNRCPS
jgi:hypothetical protein